MATGEIGSMVLIPEIVDAVGDVPVLELEESEEDAKWQPPWR